MYRSPVFLILGLVLSSMLTAVLVWNTKEKNLFGEISLASKQSSSGRVSEGKIKVEPPLNQDQVAYEKYLKLQADIAQALQEANAKISKAKFCEVCAFDSAGLGSTDYSFETEAICRAASNEKRLYYKREFDLMPDIFKLTRPANDISADFPEVCATYIMRHGPGVAAAMKGKASPRAQYYAKCDDLSGKPVHLEWPMCITETYVNSVYYAFTDVFSCFGIPQKNFLPKLFQESGMHSNSLGANAFNKKTGQVEEHFDAGLGQLTQEARPTDRTVAQMEKEINDNAASNPACARVQKFIMETNDRISGAQSEYQAAQQAAKNAVKQAAKQAVKEAARDAKKGKKGKHAHQIPVMAPIPVPPTKMDLHYFVHNFGIDTRCEMIAPPKNPFLNIFYMAAKVRDDQITISNYFDNEISVSYTVKPKVKKLTAKEAPKVITKTYTLRQAIEATGLLKQEMDATGLDREKAADKIMESLSEFANIHAYNLGPKGASDLIKNFFKMKLSLGKRVTRADFDFHAGEKNVKKGAKIKKDADLTYPEFILKHYPDNIGGAKLYLVQMAARADKLNTVFKEGTCVPDGFLRL